MQGITFKEYGKINMDELLFLYNRVGWSNYTSNPSMLYSAYQHSLKIISARDDDKLVGIIRVVGDGHSIIYIQDIVVLPEYQRKGIGFALMNAIHNIYKNVYQKVLLTDNTEKTTGFYEKCGFVESAKFQCTAFVKPSS